MRRPSREVADARLKLCIRCISTIEHPAVPEHGGKEKCRIGKILRMQRFHMCLQMSIDPSSGFRETYRVALLPGPSSTETKTREHRPRPALEQQDREDHTEGRAEGAADKKGAEAVVPLESDMLACTLASRPCSPKIHISSLFMHLRSLSCIQGQAVPSRSEVPRSWACWGGRRQG